MKKYIVLLLVLIGLLSADNPVYLKLSLEKSNQTKLLLQYSWKQDDAYFSVNKLADYISDGNLLGTYYLSQKVVLSNEEKDFYKLDFNDGLFVVCGDKIYGCDSKHTASVLSRNKVEEYILSSVTLFPADIEKGKKIASSFEVLLENIPDPTKITGLVMIYGTENPGVQPLDFYNSGVSVSDEKAVFRKQKSCEVIYLEIKKVEKLANNKFVLIPGDKYKKSYLGDGAIIAPLWIPIANMNSQKTKESIFKSLR